MSHTVLRGKPTAAQLHLDGILNELFQELGIKPNAQHRHNVTITQLLFHCLKKNPDAVFMSISSKAIALPPLCLIVAGFLRPGVTYIAGVVAERLAHTNGATGDVITNRKLLERVIPLARALVSAGGAGQRVMLLMRNHQHMMVVYFAVLFAGVVPFCMDPNTTAFELTHFLELIEPSYVFYDREHDIVLHESLNNTKCNPKEFIVDEPGHLATFVEGFSKDFNSYMLPKALADDTVIMLPTSGSTGLPKAAELTHRGLVIQLPTPWWYHTKFPTPTKLAMILTSNQWMTFTMMITSCIVYRVPVLMSPKINTVESVTEMLEKYRPTWTFFNPSFTSALLPTIRPDQLSSLETVILLGSPSTPELKEALKAKLPETAHLCDGYGTTETQGFIALPDRGAPITSNGSVVNCLYYKIIDESGQQLGLGQTGELCVKGPCLIKKYHKTEKLNESSTEDGWYLTGDHFYLDLNERLSFVIRKKFSFKFRGCQVAPEEVERVISSISGVHECVVTASDNGPAAAVVLQPGSTVTRENIHEVVNASLSEHKRLHGGIVFVTSLPHTHSGKLNRTECSNIILNAIANGDCC